MSEAMAIAVDYAAAAFEFGKWQALGNDEMEELWEEKYFAEEDKLARLLERMERHEGD